MKGRIGDRTSKAGLEERLDVQGVEVDMWMEEKVVFWG